MVLGCRPYGDAGSLMRRAHVRGTPPLDTAIALGQLLHKPLCLLWSHSPVAGGSLRNYQSSPMGRRSASVWPSAAFGSCPVIRSRPLASSTTRPPSIVMGDETPAAMRRGSSTLRPRTFRSGPSIRVVVPSSLIDAPHTPAYDLCRVFTNGSASFVRARRAHGRGYGGLAARRLRGDRAGGPSILDGLPTTVRLSPPSTAPRRPVEARRSPPPVHASTLDRYDTARTIPIRPAPACRLRICTSDRSAARGRLPCLDSAPSPLRSLRSWSTDVRRELPCFVRTTQLRCARGCEGGPSLPAHAPSPPRAYLIPSNIRRCFDYYLCWNAAQRQMFDTVVHWSSGCRGSKKMRGGGRLTMPSRPPSPQDRYELEAAISMATQYRVGYWG